MYTMSISYTLLWFGSLRSTNLSMSSKHLSPICLIVPIYLVSHSKSYNLLSYHSTLVNYAQISTTVYMRYYNIILCLASKARKQPK